MFRGVYDATSEGPVPKHDDDDTNWIFIPASSDESIEWCVDLKVYHIEPAYWTMPGMVGVVIRFAKGFVEIDRLRLNRTATENWKIDLR